MRIAEELRFLILAAQREGNRVLAQALKPLGVTPSQAEVLRLLQERQPLTLNGLGALLVCESGSSPSRLVDRLTTTGLIDRLPADHDRRQVRLTLTPEGARIATRIAEIEDELYDRLDTAGAGSDTGEVICFLHRFVDGLPAGRALAHRKETGA
ncbi:winged helix DNA-binding protein [Amycolatopsis sp. NBC_01307]|uniref:MarR family winged helix-turn-helix transcriptional regulator n=1 Tax=Amycolatopsis sp. NBC_01307 TaxID=2903561 RepID=UPI002E0EB751|nr:winged helix DNA-binding protein [Amycolatopsis sp. NBC_01307]